MARQINKTQVTVFICLCKCMLSRNGNRILCSLLLLMAHIELWCAHKSHKIGRFFNACAFKVASAANLYLCLLFYSLPGFISYCFLVLTKTMNAHCPFVHHKLDLNKQQSKVLLVLVNVSINRTVFVYDLTLTFFSFLPHFREAKVELVSLRHLFARI